MNAKKPIVLAILDGWGINDQSKGNAVELADMKNVKKLQKEYPWIKANAAGEWVGLPKGQMGNSEVGHIHLGAGRIQYESLSLINNLIASGEFKQNKEILGAINNVQANSSALHIMGLFSDGGVHSHMEHILAIYKLAIEKGLTEIYIHIFADGRDTAPKALKTYIKTFNKLKVELKFGEIASVSGRYYAMDRDTRFERTQQAYDTLVSRKGNSFNDPLEYVDQEYGKDRNDEFIEPGFNANTPNGYIKEKDSVIFANFRPDRAIQLASGFTNKNYAWKATPFLKDIYFATMTEYSDSVKTDHIIVPKQVVINPLGEWLSKKGYHQLRIAETEKIAHVTFFFDGKKDYFKNGLAKPDEITLKNAAINLIASPKVATYDLAPEMSAQKITDELCKELDKDKHDVVILNYANPDMVGHTGNLEAAIKAVKAVDKCLGQLHDKIKSKDGTLIITADHGNSEVMFDENGGPNKKHTSMLVPIIITNKDLKLRTKDVSIAAIAPTILDLLNEELPKEMTQPSLIIK
ncbi:2,3-bisphosphoglycerate-independent phosphoglycerate mutase [Spiroplasma endosymbiont of Amphibalanus improvisus]|uniref:2,3-bisphosphoglycerate-independent phosphoglycerate mutase n=1 Tax=Spiroplasma endosymbiont of Amphibalanus improvisus TaxID=3066327 RepID=UPI00313B1614